MNLQEAQELQGSVLWAQILTELDKKIIFEINKLRSCQPAELGEIQQRILCYESLKNLPRDVIDRESE